MKGLWEGTDSGAKYFVRRGPADFVQLGSIARKDSRKGPFVVQPETYACTVVLHEGRTRHTCDVVGYSQAQRWVEQRAFDLGALRNTSLKGDTQ